MSSPSAELAADSTGCQSVRKRADQSALWRLVRRLAAAAEITEWDRLSGHSLRHTGITRVWVEPASSALALSRASVITIGKIPSDDD
jgi:hypothetical protein